MTNRLAKEASPYLVQHAHNPVDWYPWGEEALARAASEDRPILLSIGYSACHWCHVMERECFENEAIAAAMNARFVNVKVDREERPDLDQIYQLVVQLLGKGGGWPLTVFLTPDQKPFFGGTYFPPEDRHGLPGFPRLLEAIADAYANERGDLAEQAAKLTQAIAKVSSARGDGAAASTSFGEDGLAKAAQTLGRRFDEGHGGFGRRPKFPNTMLLDVLLRRGVLDRDESARKKVALALAKMRDGGIYDQLGGGFHRYSTDEHWLVPHFEKMLYDNALFLRLYADGARALGDEAHWATVGETIRYLRREMLDPAGGFYATQDADSEGEEGKFFVWTPNEIGEVLGDDTVAARLALLLYGVTAEGNFEAQPTTVLSRVLSLTSAAAALGIDPGAAKDALARANGALFEARRRRIAPFRDEKILACWNALVVSALAEVGAATGSSETIALAKNAYAYVNEKLVRRAEGRLVVDRLVKGDIVRGPGFLDDHAYLADAALDLYEATGEPAFVFDAIEGVEALLADFYEPDEGFYTTRKGGEALLVRAQDLYDNAVPSGASVACRVLLRLGSLHHEKYRAIARNELARLAPLAIENPMGFGHLLGSLDTERRGALEIAVVGPRSDPRTLALAREAHRRYLPHRVIAWVDPDEPRSLAAAAALAEGKPGKGTPVAYVCQNRTCSLPVTTPEELGALLD